MFTIAIVQNLDRAVPQPARIRICNSFGGRLRGLMFRTALRRDEGLLLVGARDSRLDSAIHMLFVPFDLAVFWINSSMQVVDKVVARAWHPAYFPSQPARYVLELHHELYSAYEVGNKVEIINA
ncbi:MAG: DUF192 domain-containing protein [Chloroflexota bacterium]